MTDLEQEEKSVKKERTAISTDLQVKALKATDKRYRVQIKGSRGLFIEVTTTGAKSWHYRYSVNGKQQRLVMGQYPDITLAKAIQKRDEAAGSVADGKSPAKEKAALKRGEHGGISFYDFTQKYYDEVITKERKKPEAMLRILNNDLYPHLAEMPMVSITASDIQRVIWMKKDAGFDAAAYEVRGLLKRIFDYAMSRQIIPFNPVLSIKAKHVFKAKSRDRNLSNVEITQFYRSILDSRMKRAHKLAFLLSLLTMIRKTELTGAKWSDVDFETRIWLIPDSKNEKPLNVYMSNQVIDLLTELKKISGTSSFLFPSRKGDAPIIHNTLNKSLIAYRAATGVEHFTVHDLRRTASTHLNEMGFNRDHIEKCLNHFDGSDHKV
jgi:integrase